MILHVPPSGLLGCSSELAPDLRLFLLVFPK